MVFRESGTVELKSIVTDDIEKEMIAFANCEGGKLYIGVQDDGTVIWLKTDSLFRPEKEKIHAITRLIETILKFSY